MKKFLPAILALLCAMLQSCSLWHDDLEPCDYGCYVHFVYDYNTAKEDRFDKLVGGVTVLVYDQNNRFVTSQTGPNDLLQLQDYVMHLDLQPGTYNIGCVAMQLPEHVLWQDSGPSFRYDLPKVGDKMSDFQVVLDRKNGQVDNSMPLDTLWTTLKYSGFEVKDMQAVHDTLHLFALPNFINVNIHNISQKQGGQQATYTMKITAENGTSDLVGDLHDDELLTYHSLETTTGTDDKGQPVTSAKFMISRMVLYDSDADNNSKGPRLTVTDDLTGDVVFDKPIAPLLAQGNKAWAKEGWSEQEYLDREHYFDIDINVDGTHWSYAVVRVNILSWALRIQNIDL